MSFARDTFTGDGATTNFSITFPYILKAHVLVYIDGTLKTLTTHYTWFNATTISFNTAPALNAVILIKRSSSQSTKLVDFQDASTLTEASLDRANDQMFYMAQEAVDQANTAIVLDTDDKWNANSKVIKSLANPVANNDAVNLYTLNAYYTGSLTPTAENIIFVPAGGIAAVNVQAAIEEVVTDAAAAYQPLDADLTDLSTKWAAASASAPAGLAFAEDTDNGTNKVTLSAPATLGSDVAVTLPDTAGTIAVLEKAQVFTKQQTPLKAALSHASPTTWDCAAAQVATWAITGSVSLSAPTNQVAGTFYVLVVTQDGTGGRAVTWNSAYKFADGLDVVLSTAASAVDILTFYSDGTNMYCVGAAQNLS